MTEEMGTPKQIHKLRIAFRKRYNKFNQDYNRIAKDMHALAIDADLVLAAMEEIMDYASTKKEEKQ